MDTKAMLLRLQEIDTTQEKVRRRILALQKFSEGSTGLNRARSVVDDSQNELQRWRSEQVEAELEAQSLQDRIRESESKLMSGDVQNPRELEALQNNVDSMRRHKENLEERSVEALMKIEELSPGHSEKEVKLAEIEEEWKTKKETVEEELQQRKREYAYLKKLREETASRLSKDEYGQYEHLRKRKNGVAVSKLEEDICSACHTQVATGVIGTVRNRDELTLCPACGRILVTA